MIILHEDYSGGVPDGSIAEDYWGDIGSPVFPVTADPYGEIVGATEWNGRRLPGKCVLSPEMVMLDCYTGDNDADGFALIAEDWAARP